MSARLPVFKMNGIGNAIAVVDLRAGGAPLSADEARALAAPERGLRFDQLMAIHPADTDGTDGTIRIYNSDGTDAGACGNGMRCVADVLFASGVIEPIVLRTRAGTLLCSRAPGGLFTIDMGAPRFAWSEIPLAHAVADTNAVAVPLPAGAPTLGPATVVNMGNPHAVFWVDDLAAIDLASLGPTIERHPLFPDRVNVSFAQVLSPEAIRLAVWERGAGATRACGSAACAVAVAAARTGRTGRRVSITLPGGTLAIHWRPGDDHVLMTGPTETEAVGEIDRDTLTVTLGRSAA
ncbi:diaminopimelate epimerase [Segnochrobactrum spirostomi]|uniref:Diaminopimelate epimerase n=1 Tax=Segnochrobactrum spirostomi TaxID=2608987 RepID=A0A6A7Y152_9HYPH|nr:diaminopimelate epimerase [Segnochrobactrum spirostomi]MQT12188.1 diaminopimelate epimerase [Segnochrobactrum spirostomi]